LRLAENTGGAGGFHEGVKRGYELGYDWLWLMDDDAEPYLDSLFLLEPFFERPEIVALANAVVKPNGEFAVDHRGITDFSSVFPVILKTIDLSCYRDDEVEIDLASFVGLLVRKNAVEKVGFPEKKYFIHCDDVEYCLRLLMVGKLLLIPESKIKHKEASNIGSKRISFEKLWLKYYLRRNLISLSKHYSKNKFKLYFGILKFLTKGIGGIILFDDQKLRRIKFTISMVLDGLTDTFDNEKPKKILYK
jgi:rhamnopyranosyl-N-acetylglucosaminyl-diphospho-decaprenol beta-1,3/1,4-galactofuranosyltransferase